jgi:hypothetical protein
MRIATDFKKQYSMRSNDSSGLSPYPQNRKDAMRSKIKSPSNKASELLSPKYEDQTTEPSVIYKTTLVSPRKPMTLEFPLPITPIASSA